MNIARVNPIFQSLQEKGAWYSYDFLTPQVLADGTLEDLINRKVISATTTNPTSNSQVWERNVVQEDGIWRETVQELAQQGLSAREIYDEVFIKHLVKPAAEILRQVNNETHFGQGYVSYEFSPTFAKEVSIRHSMDGQLFNEEKILAQEEIMRLDNLLREVLGSHNFFIKVHGTNTGIAAAQESHRQAGVNVNYTLLSRRAHVLQAMEAHRQGACDFYYLTDGSLRRAPASEAVFSAFVSRTDREIDPLLVDINKLKEHVDRRLSLLNGALGGPEDAQDRERLQILSSIYELLLTPGQEKQRDAHYEKTKKLLTRAGIAYIKTNVYPLITEEYLHNQWWNDFSKISGARTPYFYWGSTGVKVGGQYTTDPHYFKPLKGAQTVNTSPPEVITMLANMTQEELPFDDSLTIENNLPEEREVLQTLHDLGIDIELILQDIQDKGIVQFSADDLKTMQNIEQSIAALKK